MKKDEIYIKQCFSLATKGLGAVQPNPMVGCVIVHDGKVIGQGYHKNYGEAHAEVNALDSVKEKELLAQSTLYINLEPCCHTGKTPPCTDLIIKSGIKKVVVSVTDPYPKVNGKGIAALIKSGIEVKTGVLENDAKFLNRRFFRYEINKRPFIVLKWAQSKDGFIAKNPGTGAGKEGHLRISGEFAQVLVHKWRSEEQAILIGTNTALLDNPQLTVRYWKGGRNPIRIVLDRNLMIPATHNIYDKSAPTLVINGKRSDKRDNIELIKVRFDRQNIGEILDLLFLHRIQSVLVEGGEKLLNSFISSGLWDEARVFTSIAKLEHGVKSPAIPGKIFQKIETGEDELVMCLNK